MWNTYKTETLIWGTIPSEAIIARWCWSDLEANGILRSLLRLALGSVSTERTFDSLRSDLKEGASRFNAANRVGLVSQNRGPRPDRGRSPRIGGFMLAAAPVGDSTT